MGGYQDVFGFRTDLYTCGCGGLPSRIDYMLYKGPTALARDALFCPVFSGLAMATSSLMGKFKDLEELLGEVGSDHVPLAITFCEQKSGSCKDGKGKGKGRGTW